MRPTLLVALLLVTVPATLAAQQSTAPSATDSVRRAALDYVEGFYEGDSAKFARGVSAELFKYGYDRAPSAGAYVGERMTFDEAIAYIKRVKARGRPTPATAPKEIVVFDVLDQTASAKLTAWWGVDYLLLARSGGKWMVVQALWQSPPPRAPAR